MIVNPSGLVPRDYVTGFYMYPDSKDQGACIRFDTRRLVKIGNHGEPSETLRKFGIEGLADQVVEILNSWGKTVALLLLPMGFRQFKKWREARNNERNSYWPLFVRQESTFRYSLLKRSGLPPAELQRRSASAISRASEQEEGQIYVARFSTRAHTIEIDTIVTQASKLRANRLEVEVWLLDFNQPMLDALSVEVAKRKQMGPIRDPLIKAGVLGATFFKLDAQIDYIINLVRLYITLRKLQGLPRITVVFYKGTPSLRATILKGVRQREVLYSLFPEGWPGVTDIGIHTKRSNHVDKAIGEMSQLKSDVPIEATKLDIACADVLEVLRTQVRSIDSGANDLTNCWSLINKYSRYDRQWFIKHESALSNMVSGELDLHIHN